MTVSLHDQIRCVAREVAIRERVYPRWVREGKMKKELFDAEIAGMRAVLETLTNLDKEPGLYTEWLQRQETKP